MQILETSMFGLRSARFSFRRPGSPVTVTIFPMVHIGAADFYRSVSEQALSHDVVLFEGVRSPVSRHITRSYRWINLKRLELVLQPRLSADEDAGPRLVHADLSEAEFMREWRRVPLWQRAALRVVAPLIGLHRYLFLTREALAKGLTMEDLRSETENLDWEPRFERFHQCILDARDERLVACLADALAEGAQSPSQIAIVYGAGHMRAVAQFLNAQGFRAVEAQWMTIFTH